MFLKAREAIILLNHKFDLQKKNVSDHVTSPVSHQLTRPLALQVLLQLNLLFSRLDYPLFISHVDGGLVFILVDF